MHLQLPLALLSTSSLVQSTSFGGADAPSGAMLKSVVYGGSGCEATSNTSWNVDQAGGLQFVTPNLKASLGSGHQRTDARKFCQFNMDVRYPDGWQFAAYKVGVTGFADMGSGVGGLTRGDVYFAGNTKQNSFVMNLPGEMHQEYKADYEPAADVVWSLCGMEGTMNVKVESRFDTRDSSSASISTDGVNIQIQWRRC